MAALNPRHGASDHEAQAGALIEWARHCAERGWNQATSGNFSVVVGREPLRLLVTRSGADKGRMAPSDLILVDEAGKAVEGGGTPSAETPLHLGLVVAHQAGAIGHTHSVWSTILSERFAAEEGIALEGFEMQKALAGVTTHERRLVLPIIPNSQDWTAEAARAVKATGEGTVPGLLIRRHGLYAWGRDIEEASRHLEALEFLLEVRAREVAYSR